MPISSLHQSLDVTSCLDKEGPLRMRGHEKVVELSQREFGHYFLRDSGKVRVGLDVLFLVPFLKLDCAGRCLWS